MGDMKAIIVEDVDGLADCINAAALALVWEDRIVIDTELRKKPNLRRNALRHEWRHIMNVRKRGMTKKAGRVNALIEHEYQWALWAMVGGLVASVLFQNPKGLQTADKQMQTLCKQSHLAFLIF